MIVLGGFNQSGLLAWDEDHLQIGKVFL